MMLKKTFIVVVVALVLFAPAVVMAGGLFTGGYWGPLLTCSGGAFIIGDDGNVRINPKPCNTCALIDTAANIISFVLTLILYVFTPVLIAWGGLLIMTAGGSTERVTQGKKIIQGTLMAIFLGFVAYYIVDIIFTHIIGPVTLSGSDDSTIVFDWRGESLCSKIPASLNPAPPQAITPAP